MPCKYFLPLFNDVDEVGGCFNVNFIVNLQTRWKRERLVANLETRINQGLVVAVWRTLERFRDKQRENRKRLRAKSAEISEQTLENRINKRFLSICLFINFLRDSDG